MLLKSRPLCHLLGEGSWPLLARVKSDWLPFRFGRWLDNVAKFMALGGVQLPRASTVRLLGGRLTSLVPKRRALLVVVLIMVREPPVQSLSVRIPQDFGEGVV